MAHDDPSAAPLGHSKRAPEHRPTGGRAGAWLTPGLLGRNGTTVPGPVAPAGPSHESLPTPRSWSAAEVVRVTEVAERTWAAVERAPAEARRREREDLLRSLFESTDEGVMVIERLPLRADGLRDWRYVAMNAKAGAMFGKPDLSGQSVRDNFPDEDEGWYDIYDHVLETSESIRFERESVPQRMVLEMYLSRVDGPNAPRLIVLLRDVTARRRAVDALTRREERQAFLLALSDRLRPLADPVEVMAVASEALGRRLGVGRCGYGEVDATDAFLIVEHDWTDGVMASLKGTLRLDDFGPQLIGAYRAGRTVVLEDVLSDARAHGVEAAFEAIGGLRASLAVPLLKDGRWVAALYAQQTRPRRWTADDEELVREVAERTWAAVERARAEAALRHSEQRLQFALSAAEMGTFVWYPAADRGESDARNLALFGLTKDDTLNLARAHDLIPLEDREAHIAAVQRAVDPAGDGVLRSEHRIIRPSDGAERWISTLGQTRFAGEPPVAVALAGVCLDITERKRAEQRQAYLLALSDALRPLADPLAIQQQACRMLAECLQAGRAYYVEVDEDAGIARVARDFVRGGEPSLAGEHAIADFGGSIAILRGGRCHVVADTRSSELVPAADRAACAALQIIACMGAPLIKDGRLVGALCVTDARPREWSDGEVELLREVSGRIWAAIERTRAEAAVREADRRKDEFLATLAHELRNPLAPISNALALLKTGSNRVDSTGVVAIIERQVQHMIRLVDDLLDVSRISRGVIELRREPLDLRTALDAAIETSRPAIEQGRHTLILRMPPDPLPIEGDAVRLAQVFANLLNNAARYSEDGGRIVLTARRERSEALVSVRDTGIGIAAEQLTQVFELFGQVNRHHSRAQGGLGIGLNLAQRLVRMHGGSMQASSAGAGHGSVFSVRLPLAAGAGPHGQDAKPEAVSSLDRQRIPVADVKPDAVPNLEGQRILVVDDNRDAAESLALLLRIEGAEAIIEHDGAAALARIGHWPPSVVLLDIGMPGMDGLEAARRIRADRRFDEVMLVALTGWGQDMDRQRTREAGFDHHLTKPVSPAALLAALRGAASGTKR